MPAEILLDVSELEPPEPLVQTLEAAEQLQSGQYLRMLHRRDPCMLFDNLDSDEYRHFQRKGTTTAVEVFIWRNNDIAATAAVSLATGENIISAS